VTGRAYWIKGKAIGVLHGYTLVRRIRSDSRWTVDDLEKHADDLTFAPDENPEFAEM
jgi:hypothetical protein